MITKYKPKKRYINETPLEYEEQCAFVDYLERRGLKFTSIPNSTFTKSWKQKTANRNSGLRAGFPDLIVLLPNKLLAVEIKRLKGGVLSCCQKGWIKELNKIDNVEAVVCKGCDEAIKVVEDILTNQ